MLVMADVEVTHIITQYYTNLDDLPSPTCIDSSGLKPFTLLPRTVYTSLINLFRP